VKPVSKRPPPDPIAEARRQWIAHGWEEAAVGMTTVTSVIRLHQLLQARLEAAVKPFGLTFARYELLRLLAFTKDGVLPLSSAVARLQVHPTSVTNTLERLVRDGLAERRPHPTDGRAALVHITDAGREVVEEATVVLNEVFTDMGIERDDELELVRIIARVRKAAGDFADPPPSADPL
jgi:DNA-binding MarR family transcriptional regulator